MVSRAERLAKEIKHAVAEFLIRSAPEGCGDAMLTVSRVDLTSDLREARIYVSVFPPDDDLRARCLEALRKYRGKIRLEVGEKVLMRYVPRIKLFIDDTLDNVERVNTLLQEL
ncbi:MAG: 30S ribosome-binding factor RbfA [Candidatus Marinimicrobia bacterium]|nr:30S ribosome-binding factor RbfA [Candidatus Neomarinimicrobiota bacterium]